MDFDETEVFFESRGIMNTIPTSKHSSTGYLVRPGIVRRRKGELNRALSAHFLSEALLLTFKAFDHLSIALDLLFGFAGKLFLLV